MPFVKRAVFDTSSLVGAVLRPSSVPRKALMLAVAQMQLCASLSTLGEFEQVITRPAFDRYLNLAMRREFAALYRRHVRVFEVQSQEESRLIEPCRDPRDNKLLALAIVASADLIVSSDDDLLSMSPYQGILIVKPADFVGAYA
ncbi:MAG: hypothetical protein RL458_751 [Pseudomonadota bacterium]